MEPSWPQTCDSPLPQCQVGHYDGVFDGVSFCGQIHNRSFSSGVEGRTYLLLSFVIPVPGTMSGVLGTLPLE